MDKRIVSWLFYLTILLNIFLIGTYLMFPIIGDDSGFYLAVARELYSGKIYFHEIGISYNPLSIITFGIPFLFDEHPNYSWHLAINILVIIGSSIVFYRILNYITSAKIYNLFFSSLFVLLSLVLDGKYIMLEPLSVLFQLLALYFYLKFIKEYNLKNIFLVGIFVCLSFLSKQYGLFIVLPIGIDLLVRKLIKVKNIGMIGLGFILPLGLFFSYLSYYGVNLIAFAMHILGKGVVLDKGNGTGISTHFFSYPLDTIYVLLFNLYIFVIPILLIKYFKKLDNYILLFILLAISSLSVLYFANYWHYYQYIIPYWIILFAYLFQKVTLNKYKVVIALMFCFSFIFTIAYSIFSFKGKEERFAEQRRDALVLTSHIAAKSEVFLESLSPFYYYRCNLKSINLKKIGFTFPGYFYPKTIVNNLNPGAYIVVSKGKFSRYENLISDCSVKELKLKNEEYFIIKKNKIEISN